MSMNFVTFNQDHSHLAVGEYVSHHGTHISSRSTTNQTPPGTSKGFRIYTTDPFSKCFETKQGDISLVEMLFSTSLVALILSPRRLQITNTKVRRFFLSSAACLLGLELDNGKVKATWKKGRGRGMESIRPESHPFNSAGPSLGWSKEREN